MIKYVYSITDPRDNQVKYIGSTYNINKRIHWHHSAPSNIWVSRMLGELYELGLRPIVKVIDKTENWKDAESQAIRASLQNGDHLLNKVIWQAYQSVLPFWFMGTRSTSDPFYQELGKALKKARLTADITPSQAAASADLSSSNAIGRYENATRTPDIKTLAALSTTYSVTSDSLIAQAQSAAAEIKKGKNVKR